MSRLKGKVCDICGKKVEPSAYGFFIFPARKFYKKKFNFEEDKNEIYPQDMCERCFERFIKFCRKESIESEE